MKFVVPSTLLPVVWPIRRPWRLQPLVQLRAGHGLQQADHRRDDPAFLDELDLPLKNRRRVAVEPDDEPALHLQPRALDAFHVGDQVAPLVLALVALGQARLLGRLDADEHLVEPRLDHQPHQLLIVGEIDGCLGVKRDAAPAFLPLDQRRQQVLLERPLVADEIVVHEEDRPAPAEPAEAVQLGDHLRRRLGAGPMAEHRGDVAELAVERAAARELHAHRGVAPQVRQLPQRRRRLADVGELRRRIHPLARTRARSRAETPAASPPPRSARNGQRRETARARR